MVWRLNEDGIPAVPFSQGAASFFMFGIVREKTVCFTGHRSQKLPWKFDEEDDRCKAMKARLRAEIEKAIESGYDTFLCGMALGFDMICAEIVLELKQQHPAIKIIGALPCRTQDCKWLPKDKQRYRAILERLDGIRCVYDKYVGAECMLERNRFMVDNSTLMIALFDGTAGGTKYTVQYAQQQGLKIVVIQP